MFKTTCSERNVHLVRIFLWAARKIKEQSPYHSFAFTRNIEREYCNINSVSAALNKWLKSYIPETFVLYFFINSFRNR